MMLARREPATDAARSAAAPDGALLITLSVIAGSSDVIGFLGLGGLFTNHITGNLVLLAAHYAGGGDAAVAKMLAVPVYVATASLATLLASRLYSRGRASLSPLLALQLVLLAAFLALCLLAGPRVDPNATFAIVAGMCGVSAMAVQNTLVQISLEGRPPTAMMTGNVTRFAIDVSDVLIGGDPARIAKARRRAAQTLPLIVGFAAGCGLGAALQAAIGLRSLALPVGLAAVAYAQGLRSRCK